MNSNPDLTNNESDSFFYNKEKRIHDYYYGDWEWTVFERKVHATMLSCGIFEASSFDYNRPEVTKQLAGVVKSVARAYGSSCNTGFSCSHSNDDEPKLNTSKPHASYARVIAKSGCDVIEVSLLEDRLPDQWIDLLTLHLNGNPQSLQILNKAWKHFLKQLSEFYPRQQILKFSVFLESRSELYQKVLNASQMIGSLSDGEDVFRIDPALYTPEECLDLTSYFVACRIIEQAFTSSKNNLFHFIFNSCFLIPDTHRDYIFAILWLYIQKCQLPLACKKDECINDVLKSLPIDQTCSLVSLHAYAIVGEAISRDPSQFLSSLLKGVSLLPTEDRNAAWSIIRSYVLEKYSNLCSWEENSLEEILAELLFKEKYPYNDILAILQTIGLVALAAPDSQGQCQYSLETTHGERLLRLSTSKSDYFFPFSWQAPTDLLARTAGWKEMMPSQFKFKLLHELLLPNLDISIEPCPSFKKTLEFQHIKNWSVTSFDLMSAQNPFIVLLGYRLYFTERLLNNRLVLMNMKTYFGQCAVALAYLPAGKGKKRRRFFSLIAKYSGAPAFTSLLNQLERKIDWSSTYIGKPICQLIGLLSKEANSLYRQAAWTLCIDFHLTTDLAGMWIKALKALLTTTTPFDNEKFTEVRLLLKGHCEEKRLYPLQAVEAYQALMVYAGDREDLHLALANDLSAYLSTVPSEFLRSSTVFQFIADAVTPLLKQEHVALCAELVELVTHVCENIPNAKLASAILKVCYLLDSIDPKRAYNLWTRIQHHLRSEKEASDLPFVISAARRMYHAILADDQPQPEFPRLVDLLEKCQAASGITPTELRKFRLVLSRQITEQDIETVNAIIQESSVDNQHLNFDLRLPLFQKQLESCQSSSALEKLLPEFNHLLDLASDVEEFVRTQKIYHQFFNASCSEKLYSLIVIDRLVNNHNCLLAFGKSYDTVLISLLTVVKSPKTPPRDESFLLKQMGTAIAILVKNNCQHALGTIIETLMQLDNRTKLKDSSLLNVVTNSVEWLTRGLQKHPKEQKAFLSMLINRIPEQFKGSLLASWMSLLISLIKSDYDETLSTLLNSLRVKGILAGAEETAQITLIESVIDQWKLNPLVPCDIDQWIECLCTLAPSEEYLGRNKDKFFELASCLLAQKKSKSAILILRLMKNHAALEKWNEVLDNYFHAKEYDLWMQTILSNREIFQNSTCIAHFPERSVDVLSVLLNTSKDKQAVYRCILQLFSRYPIDSIVIWKQLLDNLRVLGNQELKYEAVKIVTSKDFNVALFSDDREHGLACWSHVVTFLLDSAKFDRSWLTNVSLLNKPFLRGSTQDIPFLVTLLALYLQAPKQESEKNMRLRLKEAFNIWDAIAARTIAKEQIPAKQKPLVVQLIAQSSRSKGSELYCKGCALAEWIQFDKEAATQASQAIESLFTHAAGFSASDNFNKSEAARSLLDLTTVLTGNGAPIVNVYLISRELSLCKLYRESLSTLNVALVNQKINPASPDFRRFKEQLEIQINLLIDAKISFTDADEELLHHSDLLRCLDKKTIETLSDKSKYARWKEIVFSRILNLISPRSNGLQLTATISSSTVLFLDSYSEHLKSPIETNISARLLEQTIRLLGLHGHGSPDFFKHYFNRMNNSFLLRLQGRQVSEKQVDFYLQFLVLAGLAIQGLYFEKHDTKALMDLRSLYKEKVHCFCNNETFHARARTRLIFHFSFVMMVASNFDQFDDHLSDIHNLLVLANKKKLYPNIQESGEYNTLHLLSCSKNENATLFDVTLKDELIADILERATVNCFNTYCPFAINRALEILDDHISLISSQRFRERIILPALAALSCMNLDSPLITRNISQLSLTLKQLFESEIYNNKGLEESQDTIINNFMVVIYTIIQKTSLKGHVHSQKIQYNYEQLLRLMEIMSSDDAFLDVMENIIAQLSVNADYLSDQTKKLLPLQLGVKLERSFKVNNEKQSVRIQSIKDNLLLILQSCSEEQTVTLGEFNLLLKIFGKSINSLLSLSNPSKQPIPPIPLPEEDDEESENTVAHSPETSAAGEDDDASTEEMLSEED